MTTIQKVFEIKSNPSVTSISFKKDQMFFGKISKHYPGNIALVKVGNMNLHAKLESALELHSTQWFKVASNENIPVLSVVQSMEGKTSAEGTQADQVLENLKLTKVPYARELVSRLVQEQIPFSKQNVQAALGWMKHSSNPSVAISTIGWMLAVDAPFTEDVFKSVISFQETSLSTSLNEIFQLIKGKPYATNLQSLLFRLIGSTERIELEQFIKSLLQAFIQSSQSKEASVVLTKLGIVDPTLLLESLSSGDVLPLAKQLNPSLSEAYLSRVWESIKSGKGIDPDFSPQEELLLKQALNRSEFRRVEGDVTKQFLQGLRQITSLLGLEFENQLATNKVDKELQALKPLLLQTLEENIPLETKGAIQQLVNRLTGQQLLSMDFSGYYHNSLLQVPIHFGDFLTDLTIQWHGKKTKEGKVDPDYCRILFYLEFPTLKEIVVDVNVQQKVVSIQIINDHPFIKQLVTTKKRELKNKLEEAKYQLTSIRVVESKKSKGTEDTTHHLLTKPKQGGVDFRV